MALDDQIAALPGGQALAALLARVENAPPLSSFPDKLKTALVNAESSSQAVRNAVELLEQTWTGSGADAFVTFMTRFAQASAAFQDSGSQVAAALAEVGSAFEELRLSVTTICTNLLIQVDQIHAAQPGAAPDSLDGEISGLVSQATAAAQLSVTAYDETAGWAGGVLSSESSLLGQTFSSLAPPGDEPTAQGSRAPVPLAPEVMVKVGTESAPVPLAPEVMVKVGTESAPSPDQSSEGSQVDTWIDKATEVLEASGVPASQLDHNAIALIVQHESSGDPQAVNDWDYNAANGTPSIGLMQTIQPTFDAYALPDHLTITDPVDNIIAGVRYALARYGSLDAVPGVVAVRSGQPYVGY